jgi:hypothetical protein
VSQLVAATGAALLVAEGGEITRCIGRHWERDEKRRQSERSAPHSHSFSRSRR